MTEGPARVAILTVSDGVSAGSREDRSGDVIETWVAEQGFELAGRAVVADEGLEISRALLAWTDGADVDVVVTTGGTGFSERDVTPEATLALLERPVPGIGERIRAAGAAKTPYADLGRGVAGLRGKTLLVNLPGGPAGVEDGLAVLAPLIPHASALLRGEPTTHDRRDRPIE